MVNTIEVGTDEAGRGCLAGPVVAAAVVLPLDFEHALLNDSKQLTEKQREVLRTVIEEEALAYAVSYVFEMEIDQINILQASILAMHKSIAKLNLVPEHIIVDGNKFKPYKDIPHKTIVIGDSPRHSCTLQPWHVQEVAYCPIGPMGILGPVGPCRSCTLACALLSVQLSRA